MFLVIPLKRVVRLEPRFFGKDVPGTVRERLRKDVEGRWVGESGFVIAVLSYKPIGPGLVEDGTGYAVYHVECMAVVFKVFVNEVIDAVVRDVKSILVTATAGPLNISIPQSNLRRDMVFDKGAADPCFNSPMGKIQRDSSVRIRIIGIRVDVSDQVAVATMEEDCLGVIA